LTKPAGYVFSIARLHEDNGVAMFDPTNQSHYQELPVQFHGSEGVCSPAVELLDEDSTRSRHRLTSAELFALQRRFDHFIETLNAPRRRYSR
jgi:hypothetical protein